MSQLTRRPVFGIDSFRSAHGRAVARDYSNPKIGGYENGYVRYNAAPQVGSDSGAYKFPYTMTSGETGSDHLGVLGVGPSLGGLADSLAGTRGRAPPDSG